MSPTPIIEKIQLLLNKADRTDNEHESEAFYAAAQKLMQRHAVEESMLPGNEQKKEKIVKVVIVVKKRDEIGSAKQILLSGIARANRCRIVIAKNSGQGEVWVFGYESDTEFVHMLYLSVLIQYATARNRGWKEYQGPESRYLWVNAFAQGYARRVGVRLQEMAVQTAKEVGSELVLFDRSKDVTDWMNKNLSLGRGRMVRGRANSGGYGQGQHAANSANLSGGRNNLGAGSRQALGS
jgi:hypothetical protein